MAEQINVEINKIPISGLFLPNVEALEAQFLARAVEERIQKLERETGIVDSLKLALLAAMTFYSDLEKAREELEHYSQANAQKMDKMIKVLSDSVNKTKKDK
ncbi:MAG: cell division protein ZapA [Elusimicrobiaceae bacterium]|jgi:cell division protein ZapA (FtsZ GTPase activity inhibitor)